MLGFASSLTETFFLRALGLLAPVAREDCGCTGPPGFVFATKKIFNIIQQVLKNNVIYSKEKNEFKSAQFHNKKACIFICSFLALSQFSGLKCLHLKQFD